MPLLFVYGSLKEGFPNFHVNRGRRRPGSFVTAQPHELWLLDGQLPALFDAAGRGLAVRGQVFEVTPDELAAMDALERVGEPGGYRRDSLHVRPEADADAAPFEAQVYLQDPALLAAPGSHTGPLAEYTHEHARHLRW